MIEASRMPALPGTLEYAAQGIETGGATRNREGLAGRIDMPQNIDPVLERLLYDPQTSGGLLIALPPQAADAVVARLDADRLPGAIVGRVHPGHGVLVVH